MRSSGTSLEVQWLRLCASTAGGAGPISGWGTKIPHATWCGGKKRRKMRNSGHLGLHSHGKTYLWNWLVTTPNSPQSLPFPITPQIYGWGPDSISISHLAHTVLSLFLQKHFSNFPHLYQQWEMTKWLQGLQDFLHSRHASSVHLLTQHARGSQPLPQSICMVCPWRLLSVQQPGLPDKPGAPCPWHSPWSSLFRVWEHLADTFHSHVSDGKIGVEGTYLNPRGGPGRRRGVPRSSSLWLQIEPWHRKEERPGPSCATSTSQDRAAPSFLIPWGGWEEKPQPAFSHTHAGLATARRWASSASGRVTQANRSQTGSYLHKAGGHVGGAELA